MGYDDHTTTAENRWSAGRSFFDLYAHNMVRVTAAVPRVKLGDPMGNAEEIEALYAAACDAGSAVCVFPELCVTGYALDDLHQQDTILDEALAALARLKAATAGREGSVLVVGAPVRLARGLYNCAVVLSHGSTLGIVPKSYLPNFREFYESRQFVPASTLLEDDVAFLGETVRASPYTVFACRENPNFTIGVEVCQDLWVPIPPSAFQAWRGATVLVNLSASNITIGKAEYRRQLVAQASAKCYAAYVYVSAGQGESTNDLAWDGQAVIHEAGEPLGETERFAPGPRLLRADVDLDRLLQDRARDMTWLHNGADFRDRVHRVRRVEFSFSPPAVRLAHRVVPKRPYVPSDPRTLSQLCYECYNVQVSGLVQRIRSSGLTKLVIGVSGGLDSTHALLVCCRALDALEYPRANVLAYTMPGFATGATTKAYALDLMAALGVDAREIDIRPSCDRMLLDIGHPYAVDGEPAYDVTFENVQAGERTSHLFRLANHHGAFVVGTGDLSELALGWCTYGVGDHMSHYSVNASLSKSLIQCVIQWVIDETFFGDKVNAVLSNVLAVEISPELVPPSDGKNIQSTEAAIGPYDLHDFQLYHATRRGLSAPKAAFLAAYAWARDIPRASDARPVEPQPSLTGAKSILKDRDFALAEILDFQRAFFRRFFLTTQFKRTCIPNAPKVADGGSLSPRGDWRAPSDSSWAAWNRAWLRTATWALDSARDLNTEGGADLLPALQALVDKHRPP